MTAVLKVMSVIKLWTKARQYCNVQCMMTISMYGLTAVYISCPWHLSHSY